MRRSLLIVALVALGGCASVAPPDTDADRLARNPGVAFAALTRNPPPQGYGEIAAVLDAMDAPLAAAKRAEAQRLGLRLSLDRDLSPPVEAVIYPTEKLVILKDLAGEIRDPEQRRGHYRRLLEEELQHARDFAIVLEALPDMGGADPESVIARLLIEANARAAMVAALAEHGAQGGAAPFHAETDLCAAARADLAALTGDDAARRRATAKRIASAFLRERGKIYAAHNRAKLGAERVTDALRDESLIRSFFARIAPMFALPGDAAPYFDADAAVEGLAASASGLGASLAGLEIALAPIGFAPRRYWPCDLR